MNESIQTVIRFKPQLAVISSAELKLLESILSSIIEEMMTLQTEVGTELETEMSK